jgi:hypothetical protein
MRILLSIISALCFALVESKAQAQNADYAMSVPQDTAVNYLATSIIPYTVPFAITRNTQDTFAILKYSYTVNNGAPQKQTATLRYKGDNCVYPPTLAIYRVPFTTPVNMASAGDYKLKIWIDSINGQVDANPANDTMTRLYKAIPNLQTKGGLLEYFYHMTCAPCGEFGTPYIDNLLTKYHKQVSIVKVHNSYGQPAPFNLYDTKDGAILDSSLFYTSGHPNCTFNRHSLHPFANPTNNTIEFYPHVDQCPTDSAFLMRDNNFYNKVPANLSIANFTIDTITNIVSFNATATFLEPFQFDVNARLSCILVEDSLFNYQSDGNAPGPDSAYHRYVLRKIYGGPFGKPNSVPTTLQANQQATLAIVDTLDTKFKRKNLYLIPVLQKWSGTLPLGAEILNAQRFRMMEQYYPVSITNNIDLDRNFNCFPNPTTGTLTIQATQKLNGAVCKILALDGKVLFEESDLQGNEVQLDLSQLSAGMYFVSINDQGVYQCFKIFKQ